MKNHHFSRKNIVILIVLLVCFCCFYAGNLIAKRFLPASSKPNEIQITEDKLAKASEKKENNNEKEIARLNALKDRFVKEFFKKYSSADLSFYIKNLDTGADVSYNNKKMNSASIIKLFIMETVFDNVISGNYVLDDNKAKELETMITESSNQSANLFIDDFGGVNEKRRVPEDNIINLTIKNKGYKSTELNRKMHDVTPPEGPSGYENYTSVEDVGIFLEKLYNKTLFTEPYNTKAINYLTSQTRRAKIPAKISKKYPDIIVGNKTGELSHVENDAALIMCDKFNIVFVIMINDIPSLDNGDTDYTLKQEIQNIIADFGLMLTELYLEKDDIIWALTKHRQQIEYA